MLEIYKHIQTFLFATGKFRIYSHRNKVLGWLECNYLVLIYFFVFFNLAYQTVDLLHEVLLCLTWKNGTKSSQERWKRELPTELTKVNVRMELGGKGLLRASS